LPVARLWDSGTDGMCPSVLTIEGEKSPRIKGFEYADGTVGPVGTSGAGTRSWVKAICDLAEGMVPELISALGILGSGGNRNRAGDGARGNRPAAGHDQQRPAERLSGLGRDPITPEAWENVRFGAHSGLKSEIAQGPKSAKLGNGEMYFAQGKATRRRLLNSNLMIDHAAINAGFDFRRQAMKPMPAKPRIIIAHVEGSGTAAMVTIEPFLAIKVSPANAVIEDPLSA
jgi:hypothetical protein